MRNEVIIPKGSVIRLYNVQRLDVMKALEDKSNRKKQLMDFYDYILVDCSVIKDNTFCLVNITNENSNCGSVFHVFDDVSEEKPLTISHLKQYFGKAKVAITINVYWMTFFRKMN